MRGRIEARLRARWQAVHGDAAFSSEPFVVLTSAAVLLTLLEYLGTAEQASHALARLARGDGPLSAAAQAVLRGPFYELACYGAWAVACVLCYGLVPLLVLRWLRPGEPPSAFGWSTSGLRGHGRTYLLLFAAVLPLVAVAALRPDFLRTYPFYSLAGRSAFDFLCWEALYALQFLSLEFFFRGFLLHTLKRDLGAHAIFVAVVPYCMIHFSKPLPEALGAIVAGVVLGTLSLRTGSILGGAMLHVAVAVTMDVLALAQKAR
ncbi:MAG: CPBP family intramembrane glutamic endopeptidase [Vicinamibacteria bacterium]